MVKPTRKVSKVLPIVGGVLLLLISPFIYFGYKLNDQMSIKRDPTLYSSIIEKRRMFSEIVAKDYAFLPDMIPNSASRISFYYVPGVMQGGTMIGLKLTLPEDDIEKILQNLQGSGRVKVERLNDLGTFSHSLPPYPVDETKPGKGWPEFENLTRDYQIYLHNTNLESIKTHWNHNFIAYTAISKENNEVFYHAYHW